MLYFYNPTTDERVNEQRMYLIYGVTPETAASKGWFPFSLVQPSYDSLYHYPSDEGTESDGNGGYRITWAIKDKPVENVRKELKQRVAAKRYTVETSGVSVNDSTILTDRESQATITGAKAFADLNPTAVVDWKSSTGWVQISAAAISAIASAVGLHVQSCFSRERALSEAIDTATTIVDLKAVDINAGWPANPAPAVSNDPFDPRR